jgi:hypothetical protein
VLILLLLSPFKVVVDVVGVASPAAAAADDIEAGVAGAGAAVVLDALAEAFALPDVNEPP